jgi:aspartokinase
MQVLKFGGTSVANAENISKVVAYSKRDGQKRQNNRGSVCPRRVLLIFC